MLQAMNSSSDVRDNLKDKKEFVAFAARLSKDPVQISILSFIWLGTATGIVGVKYPDLGFLENLFYMAIFLLLYLLAVRYWLGSWLYLGLRHNIPFAVILTLFWITALLVSEICGFVLGWDKTLRLDRFLNTVVISIPLIVGHVLYMKDGAAQSFGKDPRLVPISLPKIVQSSGEFAAYQSADIIQSQGPYLVVTTNGVAQEFTSSLSIAVENIPPEMGLRVHRSYWVSYLFMDKVVYKNGNPRLLTKDGNTIPVSRSAVQQIKHALNS